MCYRRSRPADLNVATRYGYVPVEMDGARHSVHLTQNGRQQGRLAHANLADYHSQGACKAEGI